jgi:hypothetical protein
VSSRCHVRCHLTPFLCSCVQVVEDDRAATPDRAESVVSPLTPPVSPSVTAFFHPTCWQMVKWMPHRSSSSRDTVGHPAPLVGSPTWQQPLRACALRACLARWGITVPYRWARPWATEAACELDRPLLISCHGLSFGPLAWNPIQILFQIDLNLQQTSKFAQI